jgi:hypothetical protein
LRVSLDCGLWVVDGQTGRDVCGLYEKIASIARLLGFSAAIVSLFSQPIRVGFHCFYVVEDNLHCACDWDG